MELNLRPKLQIFTRKLVLNMLLTRDKLRQFGMDITGDCQFYYKVEEGIDYIFIICDLAINMWCTIEVTFRLQLTLIRVLVIGLHVFDALKLGIERVSAMYQKKLSSFYGLFRFTRII